MSAAILLSDQAPRPQRTVGTGRISVKHGADGTSRLDRLYQQGAAKIRLPAVYGNQAGPQAVLINSAGGLTGGDHLTWDLYAGRGAHLTATSQACEKIYRAAGKETARQETMIRVEEGASLHWLPQETILFNQSRLDRSLSVDLARGSRFLAVEAVLLGRLAMKEKLTELLFRDRWTIRKDGRLLHSEAFKLDGSAENLRQKSAILNGGTAFASLFYTGPQDAEALDKLAEQIRLLKGGAGVSAWQGKLLVRLTAPDGLTLRQYLIPIIEHLTGGTALPRVWTT